MSPGLSLSAGVRSTWVERSAGERPNRIPESIETVAAKPNTRRSGDTLKLIGQRPLAMKATSMFVPQKARITLAAPPKAASVILAFWGTNMLVAFMASGRWPISLSVSPDLRVFGFAATVSMLSGILFGLSPALRSTQVDLTPALKESPGDMSPGARGKSGIRLGLAEGLIVTQVS